ncbi:hypothetical protein IP69_06755 [Bosea sp. AAP35]|uniref:metallophosphoesterase n=1 Tax=Bosea sp. AAP35 TaxID=1523417 RepID=UPI0006B93831|nr:metallophosphoesterase [Bosea sp. AAP35]KPF71380.1 hypothetical protein IP69_06755 [Bosea sp. AAP35]
MAYLNPINDMLLRIGADATKQVDLKAAFGDSYATFSVASSDGSAVSAQIVDGVLTVSALGLGYADLVITATTEAGASVTDNVRVNAAGANAFTIAALPDTQSYTSNAAKNHVFGDMTQWLADNAESLNIDFVVGLGDVTDNNNTAQWAIASEALHRLDGKIPYSILPGNHDQAAGGSAADHSTTFLDNLFSPDAQAATNPGTFRGVYDAEPERSANSYHSFTAPDGTKWMVLSLEFAPRDDVLRWAGEVIEANLDHRVIIASHTLTTYAGRSDAMGSTIGAAPVQGYGVANAAEGANDGEAVYRLLTSQYPNVVMTLSGHVLGDSAETNISYSQFGNSVIEMMVNYQSGSSTEIVTGGGEGAIRLLTIDPDNDRIFTSTYFTERDAYLTGYRDKEELDRDGLTGPYRDHQQEITGLDLSTPELYAQAKAGSDVFVEAPSDASGAQVTLDGSDSLNADRARSYEWRDADGTIVATSAVDTIALAAGKHDFTLHVTDASGKVSFDQTRVVVSDENTLLVDNFNDGNADGWSKPPTPRAPDLSDKIAFGTTEQLGLPALPGGAGSAMFFPATAPTTEGFLIRPEFGSTAPIKSYSLAMDILVPVANKGLWFALLQTDPNQSATNDADVLINTAGGIGINGDYKGVFQYGVWQRVVLTVTDLGNGNSTLAKYVDGVLVGSQSMPTSRFQIDPEKGFLIFSDNAPNGTALQTQSGYVSSVMFSDKPLTAAQVTALGKADADGFTAAAPAGSNAVQFDFPAADPFAPSHGDGAFSVVEFDSIFEATEFGTTEELGAISLPGGSDEIMEFPATRPDEGYLIKPGFAAADGGALKSYTIIWDVFAPEATNHWMALLQTDPTNLSDADFLVNMAGGIGINGAYTGKFAVDQWQRIALTVSDNGDGTVTLNKYLQGVLVGSQAMPTSRYQIDPEKGFLIFTDEGHFQWNFETLHGYTNSVFFTDKVMSAAEIGSLGGAKAGGIMQESQIDPAHAIQFDFDNGSLDPRFGEGTLSLWDRNAAESLDGWSVKGSIHAPDQPADGEGALHDRSDAAGKLLVWQAQSARDWTDYSYDVTLQSTDNDDIGVVFYYQDAANHYRFVMDNEAVSRSLVRVKDGVETVLAQTKAGYRFNDALDLRVVVSDGRIDVLLDGKSVFDGPVTDTDPLAGGSVGVYSSGQKSSIFDDVIVNTLALTAHGEGDVRSIAAEGEDGALVQLSAKSSFGPADIVSYRWLLDGEVLAQTADAAVMLPVGTKQVVLEVTDSTGKVSTDVVAVDVVGRDTVLMQDRFENGALDNVWSILDEGTIEGPSDWAVEGGRLVQKSNIYSEQLTAGGPSNANDWQKGWSPLGDGNYILRKGTIAVYDAQAAGAYGWKDYSIETSFRTPDDDGLGLVFYYQDPENYYKMELNHQYQVWTLVRLQDGIEEVLGQAWHKYAIGQDTTLRVDIVDHRISAYLDGEALFPLPIEDRGLTSGTFGLYSWGSQGVSFDDVTVVSLAKPAAGGPLLGTAGDDVLVGTSGDDVILAGQGDDLVEAGDGRDTVEGGEGDDVLDGQAGDDVLLGGAGDDELIGGDGDDRLAGGAGDDLLDGGAGIDTADYADDTAGVTVDLAAGTAEGDESGSDTLIAIENVIGGASDDVLKGDAGDNRLEGNEGRDTLVLSGATAAIALDLVAGTVSAEGLGRDLFTGIEAFRLGEGDDRLVIAAGAAAVGSINGGAGTDTLVLSGTGTLGALTDVEAVELAGDWTLTDEGYDVAFGAGAQTLTLEAALFADGGFAGTIAGFGQEDRIALAGIAADSATLGAGNLLTLTGAATGPVTLQLDPAQDFSGMGFSLAGDGQGGVVLSYGPANAGDDVLTGGNGDDTLDGGAGNDVLKGGAGDDTLLGGAGDDQIDGGSGDDLIAAGIGNDIVKAGSGDDVIEAGEGDDVVDAGSGDDTVLGGAGNDTLDGGSGNDRITGGAGDDKLTGGSGHDVFVFAAGFGRDMITDFRTTGASADVLEFSIGLFADFDDAMEAASQSGADTVFSFDADTTLTLKGVDLAALGSDDFRFV